MKLIFQFLGTPFFILGVIFEFLIGMPFHGGRLWTSSRMLRVIIQEGIDDGTITMVDANDLLDKEESEDGEDNNG